MAVFDLERIVAETVVRRVAFFKSLDSTNDFALRELAAGDISEPLLVLAEHQTSGRGRGSNQWWAAPGALTFSLVVDGRTWDLSTRNWPRISLATSLAVCEALGTALPNEKLQLKWPNDVYLRSKKICGILVESSPRNPHCVVIGIGINVNNSLAAAPQALRDTAIAVCDIAGTANRTELLILVLNHLADRLPRLASQDFSLSDNWASHCILQGRTVCVQSGAQKFVGVCQGIDDDGALLLQSDAGLQRCFAGVVARIL
jgi:BirA family biotin operon repressor/biotin-[acetyl-CoA-carboxylase] ligase